VTLKAAFYEQIKLSPFPNDSWIVLQPFAYGDIIVPKGYITNGANIPRLFWSIWPPNRSDYMPAVVVHDYICSIGDYKKAHRYFKVMLKDLEVEKVTVKIFAWSVRAFHKVMGKYKKD
jgi:hypothetical protein